MVPTTRGLSLCLPIVAAVAGLGALACADQVDDGKDSGRSGSGGTSATSPPSTGGIVQTGQPGSEPNNGTGGINASSTAGSGECPTVEEDQFSFFLTSHLALRDLSGTLDGFGGDLGGITGADALCQQIAERSSACQKKKVWHAFLSTASVNAKDRIGSGPWYDRRGRLVAQTLSNLLTDRPTGINAQIKDDLPNEDGVPNHNPDGTGLVDNHQVLTGSGTDGNLYKQSATGSTTGFPGMNTATSCGPKNEDTWSVDAATCWGWTSKDPKGCPRAGHSWPRQGSGTNWISVWNEGGCAPGGALADDTNNPTGLDGTRRVGSAGGYGGFYCFAVTVG